MFSTFDCAVKGYRQKEDAWNAIISGFMTGGCLAARSESSFSRLRRRCIVPSHLDLLLIHHVLGGPKAAFGSAVACGILLGVFEGVGVLLGRVFSEGTRPQLPPRESFSRLVQGLAHTNIPSSTRIHDPSAFIACCYIVHTTYSHQHNFPFRSVH
jgi:Tim17/Tim22/Tim23/Pmp24 family